MGLENVCVAFNYIRTACAVQIIAADNNSY